MASPGPEPPLTAPTLERLMGRASLRLRLLNACRALLRTAVAVMAVGLTLTAWWALASHFSLGLIAPPAEFVVAGLVGVGSVSLAVSLLRPLRREWLARELDRRFGLEDRASTALAIVNGRAHSTLANRTLREAELRLLAVSDDLPRAFPARLSARAWRQLLTLALLTVGVFAAAFLAKEIPGEGPLSGLLRDLFGKGGAPASVVGSAPLGQGEDGNDDPEDPEHVTRDDPESEPDDPDDPGPDDPAGAGARARVIVTRKLYMPHEAVIVVVSGFPTADLGRDTRFDVRLELDGEAIDPGVSLDLSQDRPEGAAEAFDLREIPKADEALTGGDHTLRVILTPAGDGPPARSPEVRFKILGGDGKGGGGGAGGGGEDPGQPPPEGGGGGQKPPPPEPEVDPPPAPAPDEEAPEQPGGGVEGGEEPSEQGPQTPQFPVDFERKLVVPLFGEGEEVRKIGHRLVLVPGGRNAPRPTQRPLRTVFDEAVKRAENAVDTAGLDEADREIVRRYFERLSRWVK